MPAKYNPIINARLFKNVIEGAFEQVFIIN